MTTAHNLIVDESPDSAEKQKALASWYTQGLSDGLGDRLLMFDNTKAPSWEILRFRRDFASNSEFEAALRDSVERLSRFRHPSFSTVRAVEDLGAGDGLALVSTYVAGRRLSEAIERPRSPAFVTRLVRQLTPALEALHQQGGVAHGALTADRVLVSMDGRVTIREHVLGPALAQLRLSAPRLWAELGIVTPPTTEMVPPLDYRTDVVQLALIAASLLAGRRIGPDEYPRKLEPLLDHLSLSATAGGRSSVLLPPLRQWLERALLLDATDNKAFTTARDAVEALSEFPDDPAAPTPPRPSLVSVPQNVATTQPVSAPVAGPRPVQVLDPPLRAVPDRPLPSTEPLELAGRPMPVPVQPPATGREESTAPNNLHSSRPALEIVQERLRDRPEPIAPIAPPVYVPPPRVAARSVSPWITAAMAVLAIGEGLVIGRLLLGRPPAPPPVDASVVVDSPEPGADVIVDGRPIGVTPLALKVGSQTRSIRVFAHDASPARTDAKLAETLDALAAASASAAANRARPAPAPVPRSGRLRVSSPIELDVFEYGRLLGSTAAGPIAAAPGRHELELVNGDLGFRVRRIVDIKAGETTGLTVAPTNGKVSINALPWAAVWIDGNAVGETPLANISVPIGEHEFLFRHPQLGERKEVAIVKAEGLTRVSANMNAGR